MDIFWAAHVCFTIGDAAVGFVLVAATATGARVKLIVTTPLARYCGAMIVMMIVVTGAVRAEPVFSFDATPGKLPKTVVPISYSIELRPCLLYTSDAADE